MGILLLGAGSGAHQPPAGGGPWTPASLATASPLWFDASDAATITTSTGISQWNNKGSLGSSLTQGTGASQPTWPSAVLNGLHVARFNGTSQRIFSAGSYSIPSATTMTIMAVFAKNASAGYQVITGTTYTGTTGLQIVSAGNTAEDWVSSDFLALGDGTNSGRGPRSVTQFGVLADTGFHVARFDLGAATATYADGVAVTPRVSVNAAYPAITSPLGIGDVGSLDGAYWNGDIAEVVFAPNATAGELLKLEGYLAWKWGLQANLPGGHAYAGVAP